MAFAGVMLLISSAFNAVYGFAAILNDDYFAEEELLYGPVTVWGWLAIGGTSCVVDHRLDGRRPHHPRAHRPRVRAGPAMNEERIAIELIVSVLFWVVAVVAAFYFVGVVVGLLAIMIGVGLFGWWLARVIRSRPPASE
jgi:hypothetical protein